jgi:hypothetical protein
VGQGWGASGMKIFSLIFGGLGVLLLLIAGVVYLGEANFLRRAEPATGTVVELFRSIHDEGGNSYCPVFQFTTREGHVVSYRGNVCASPPAYKVGDRVELFYDPADLNHVQMNSFWSKYVGVFVLGVIGAPFTLLGLISLIGGMPKSRLA